MSEYGLYIDEFVEGKASLEDRLDEIKKQAEPIIEKMIAELKRCAGKEIRNSVDITVKPEEVLGSQHHVRITASININGTGYHTAQIVDIRTLHNIKQEHVYVD